MTQTVEQSEAPPAERLDDLTQIIRAYNEVTENLQRSHDALRQQVERLQHELASTDAKLQRSKRLAALGEMAAGIAHEIRNPLAGIHLYAKMIVEDIDAVRNRDTSTSEASGTDANLLGMSADHAGKIADAVRGLNGIVNDVLTFSRELRPKPRWVPAKELIQRAVDAHRPAIEAAQIALETSIDPQVTIWADADLLQQALLNLIRNAVDAMDESGGALHIDVQSSELTVTITVRDTGPGIAEDDIDRIFNPFFTTRNTGTGLGLAIVHRILDAHGGSINASNDGGAVFELYLPVEPIQSADAEMMASGALCNE